MNIFIDGDACPKPIKHILFRAAATRKVPLYMVANHLAVIPPSPYIKRVLVGSGFDVADDYIVDHIEKKDLVITADIILADLIVAKGAFALNPRGVLYTVNNIKPILTMRNINESLRGSGVMQGGPDAFNAKDIQAFSNHLDKLISQYHQ